MSDPVFTTRESYIRWHFDRLLEAANTEGDSDNPLRISAANAIFAQIDRMKIAHAHLLTPESDNG